MRHPFLRTLAGTTTDPNFENVTLLLHGDGTNGGQNNTFVDGSTNNFSITRNGNTTQGTFSPYGDNWSNYFDGTGDYLTCGNNAALGLGSGDYTVEYWIFLLRAPSSGSFWAPIDLRGTGGSGWTDYIPDTGLPTVFVNTSPTAGNNVVASTIAVTYNAWTHIAYVRSGTTTTVYVNGASGGSATDTNNYPAPASSGGGARIGINKDGNGAVPGYISNVRIVKGTAVYTAAFTPSTTPLTSITNTSLLTCQSNRFRDASTNNFTITRNGDVSVQRFSPFSPTSAYAAGTIGGSGYFDGTGDYLSIPDNAAFDFGTGDFTIECWVYIAGNSSPDGGGNRTAGLFSAYAASGVVSRGYTFEIEGNASTTGTGLSFYNNNSGTQISLIATTTISQGTWHHVAVCRSGTTTRLFLNGSSVASGTLSNQNVNSDYSITIGRLGYASYLQEFNGYISNLRVLKGTAQYTGTYTVPTAPLTAITNTSLLLNFTNAAILDNAMMAVPETVGNAQISTSVKKYGTGSLAFDGTGDYLTLPLSENYRFGTGSFTIEMWLYFNALTTYQCVIDMRNGATAAVGILLYLDGGSSPNVLRLYAAGAQRIASSALSTGQWYHVALSRSGTSTKLFINGTQQGVTYSTDSNDYIVNSPKISIFSDSVSGYINGYIDDLRITKGVARYTANFTAPTAAFPDL